MITLRDYTPADLEAVLTLFYETVHTVNAGDYSSAQLDAWGATRAGSRCLAGAAGGGACAAR